MKSLVRNLVLVGTVFMSGAQAMAATVTQLNITGGSVNMNFGSMGSISGSFQQSGTMQMGQYQSNFLQNVPIDGHQFAFTTSAGGLGNLAAPTAQTNGSAITADLSSLFATFTGPLSGELNIGGLATGTYDPLTGHFTLSWTRVINVDSMSFDLVGGADVAPVPVPAAAGLFATGLLGLLGAARRRTA